MISVGRRISFWYSELWQDNESNGKSPIISQSESQSLVGFQTEQHRGCPSTQQNFTRLCHALFK